MDYLRKKNRMVLQCPRCDSHIDAEKNVGGDCPRCGNEYYWGKVEGYGPMDYVVVVNWEHLREDFC